ncbi:acyltransferase family protein [Candidatus Spyradosoma sp. SGI.093]|uniref:acyltransferase family protein n=1 Tax=Candidatus Spyradosoma sp. SGI.093 TaxID=3420583 RepID=UPI003D05B671
MNALEKNVSVATAETLLSETIAWLRFPLIVLVVFIHVPKATADFSWAFEMEKLITNVFARVAVPLFFVISGFLFFRGSAWSREICFKKLRSRAGTLLVPYLTWACFALAYWLAIHVVLRGEIPTAKDLLRPFFAGGVNFPFWFIRELMVCCVAAPLIYRLVKRFSFVPVLALGVVVFARGAIDQNFLIKGGIGTTSIFFFLIGSTLALEKIDFVAVCRRYAFPLTAVYVPVAFWDWFCIKDFQAWNPIAHNFGILFGCAAAVGLTAVAVERGIFKRREFLENGAFFVFAAHTFCFVVVNRALKFLIFGGFGEGNAQWLVYYFSCGIVSIAVCLGVYRILRRAFPWSLRFLTGGR